MDKCLVILKTTLESLSIYDKFIFHEFYNTSVSVGSGVCVNELTGSLILNEYDYILFEGSF